MTLAFPAGPLRLSTRFRFKRAGVASIGLAMLAFAIGSAGWVVSDVPDIVAERATWADGVDGSHVRVTGETRSRGLFAWVIAHHELGLVFDDLDGETHTARVAFWTMMGRVSADLPAQIRFRPDEPGAVALSWARDAHGARTRAVLVLTCLFSGVALVSIWLIWDSLAGQTPESRAAKRRVETWAPLVSDKAVERDGEGTAERLATVLLAGGRAHSFRYPAKNPPFSVESKLLFVGHPDDALPFPVLEDGYPFSTAPRIEARFRLC